MALFLCIVVALGWFISYYYDNLAILIIAVIFALGMNIAGYWYSGSSKIWPSPPVCRCRTFTS